MSRYSYIFFFFLISLVGCVSNTDTVVTSSETRVQSFTFYEDTTNRGLTEMTYIIEHLSDTGRIYCKDSLRFGTRLDSVVPYVTYKATPALAKYCFPDTVIISTGADTLDLTKHPDSIFLYVLSSDMTQERWYHLDIYAHQSDPYLYVWEQLTNQVFKPQNCKMKVFYANEKLHLYVNNGFQTQIYQSVDGRSWALMSNAPLGLPVSCSVRDVLQCGTSLYYVEDDYLYITDDMLQWKAIDCSGRDYQLVNMLMVFHDKVWCILQNRVSQDLFLGIVQDCDIHPVTSIYGLNNGILPANFPISDFASLPIKSSSERPRAMVVGGRSLDGTPVNTRWNFEYETPANSESQPFAGYRVVDFSIEQPTFHSLTGMSIIQYSDHLIMFGGIDNDLEYRSDILYSDDEGMNWYVPDTSQNQLPKTYQSRQQQTVVVDAEDNIYIIGGQTNTQTFSDVYRGYLNSMKW